MSYNRGPSSPVRVRTLQLLADKRRPLSIHEMADWLDESYSTIRSVIIRARAAGWVACPVRTPGTGGQPHRYTITELGRVWLAEQKVETKEPS